MKKLLSFAMVGLIAAACSKPAATPAHAQQLINGAGSSFDYPAFTMWFSAYAKTDPSVRFNYQSVGSGAGQQQLLNQTVDFGASDAPMSDEKMASAKEKILHFPVVAGAVAITYNLPDNPQLKLDADTLAGIFLGKITKWNDDAITKLNPDVKLPEQDIVVVHRSDGSGTSFCFTDYLSAVSPEWKEKVGKGTAVKWPVGLGGKGSEGVSGQVKQLPGAIGYVEQAYAEQNHLPVADMKNAAGNFIAPTADGVSKAMATATIPDDFRFSMVNAPGADAYPIATASWILIYQKQANADTGKKLVAFLKWAVTDGQKLTPDLHYAPLPENVQERETKLLDTVTY
ncbi:MAG TPA: phosphate ABC transporter substrate-binding protein PstS [Opitutaceae bacterium]|nr:phosphate ABC transporter substrate-binding protein PstS [Opitutaceae bacterium]